MRIAIILGCITLLLFGNPALARIAPGEGGSCPEGLKLDSQSGRCLPPGESRPPLGAPNDPSSNPVKSPPPKPESVEPKSTPIKPAPPVSEPVKIEPDRGQPKQANDDEAREACAPYPGTRAQPLSGGYICVPIN